MYHFIYFNVENRIIKAQSWNNEFDCTKYYKNIYINTHGEGKSMHYDVNDRNSCFHVLFYMLVWPLFEFQRCTLSIKSLVVAWTTNILWVVVYGWLKEMIIMLHRLAVNRKIYIKQSHNQTINHSISLNTSLIKTNFTSAQLYRWRL